MEPWVCFDFSKEKFGQEFQNLSFEYRNGGRSGVGVFKRQLEDRLSQGAEFALERSGKLFWTKKLNPEGSKP